MSSSIQLEQWLAAAVRYLGSCIVGCLCTSAIGDNTASNSLIIHVCLTKVRAPYIYSIMSKSLRCSLVYFSTKQLHSKIKIKDLSNTVYYVVT